MTAHPVSTAPPQTTLLWRRFSGVLSRNATTILLGAAIAVLVLPPIVIVVYSSFVSGSDVWHGARTLAHYRTIFSEGTSAKAITNTFEFAAGSALLSVIFAALVAFFVERTNAPFRRFVYFVVVISLGVPIVVQTMGWILLLGPNASLVNATLKSVFGSGAPQVDIYTMPAMIFVQATIVFPATFLLVAPAFRLADPALEQAAAVGGASRARILREITLPLVRPSLLAAVLLSFIIGIESFEVPALIGTPARINTLSTAMYLHINNSVNPDFGAAAAFASMLMGFTILGLFLYQRATQRAHRFVTVTGKGYRPDKLDLHGFRWPSAVFTLLVPLAVVMPVLMLLWASFFRYYVAPSASQIKHMTIANYTGVLHTPAFVDALKNTFLFGVAASLVVMLLGLGVAWAVLRRPSGLSRSVDQLGSMPLVVPGVVLSLAVLRVFINLPIPIYNTGWIIVIALVIHYLPFGLRFGHSGLITMHRELEEAADVSGANRLEVLAHVVVPLMRPTLIAGGLFIFMATVRQLSLVVFLAGPNLNVVSSWIWAIWNNAALTNAAAASMIVMVPILGVAVLFYRLTGVGEGTGSPTAGSR